MCPSNENLYDFSQDFDKNTFIILLLILAAPNAAFGKFEQLLLMDWCSSFFSLLVQFEYIIMTNMSI